MFTILSLIIPIVSQINNVSVDKVEKTFLALGDSYTIGESVSEENRWPVQLVNSLKASGIPMKPAVIIAKTGWTTDELAEAIETSSISPPFDLVSLLIGVNNQYRGRTVEEFRTQFQDLLKTAIQFAGNIPGRVFVVSIPDWGVTPFASNRDRSKIGREIDQFNCVKKEETLKMNVLYIDITEISREAQADSTLLAADQLHPSPEMYKRWVEKMLPQIKKILRKTDE